MATIDDAAPVKSATPRGPGERPAARLRSASSTAERPAQSPKTPKAEAASASNPPIGETRPPVRAPCSESPPVPGHPLRGCYRIRRHAAVDGRTTEAPPTGTAGRYLPSLEAISKRAVEMVLRSAAFSGEAR
jgi:hypothetical protein